MDALILTGEPLPLPGRVTTGAGLRAWGLKQGLRSAGLDAWAATDRLAMEGLSDEVASAHHTLLFTREAIGEVIERADPACVVAQHWGLLRDVPPLAPPLAIDLAGPHLIERHLWGPGNWTNHAEEKLAALRRADFIVCSGERQRLYFLNHLALAGFEVSRDLAPAIPFSVSPEVPRGEHGPDQFVYGGMFLPWQDPRAGLEALLGVMETLGRGHLHFWGGPHPRLDVSRGRFEDLMARLGQSARVTCHGLTAFDAYVEAISGCGVALDVMARNPERELAFATRTVVYLWAGLPVVHGDFDELAPLIAGHSAGWIVSPDNPEAIRQALREALAHPDLVAERSANAQRLVLERLTWDRTIEPLAAWCRRPTRREGKTAFALAFESKDREIARLGREASEARDELARLRGKLSWRVADALLSLRWLWAALTWVILVPVCLIVGALFAIVDLWPRRDAQQFPPPPGDPAGSSPHSSR